MEKIKKLYNQSAGFILLVAGIDFVICYGFASLAISRGNLWWYLFTIIFLYYAIKNFFRFIGKLFHGRKSTKTS